MQKRPLRLPLALARALVVTASVPMSIWAAELHEVPIVDPLSFPAASEARAVAAPDVADMSPVAAVPRLPPAIIAALSRSAPAGVLSGWDAGTRLLARRPEKTFFTSQVHLQWGLHDVFQLMDQASALSSPKARAAALVGLQSALQESLEKIASARGSVPEVRAMAKGALDRFISEGIPAEEFLSRREMESSFSRLSEAAGRRRRDAKPWAKLDRPSKEGTRRFDVSLKEYRGKLDAQLERLKGAQRREALARGRPDRFTPEFRDLLKANVQAERRRARRLLTRAEDRVTGSTKWFCILGIMEPQTTKQQSEAYDPSQALRPRLNGAGGLTVDAGFETDIADPRVRKWIKASIEKAWSGVVGAGAQRLRLQIQVRLRLVRDGRFSPGGLRIVQTKEGTHAAPADGAIYLNPVDVDDSTAAHEFGHLLGLPDEYVQVYDGKARRFQFMIRGGNLMGGYASKASPEHIARVLANMLAFLKGQVGR